MVISLTMRVVVKNSGTNKKNYGTNEVVFEPNMSDLLFSEVNVLDEAWETDISLTVTRAIKKAIRDKDFNKEITVISMGTNEIRWTFVVTEN